MFCASTDEDEGIAVAAFIAADDEWVDLKGCLGVINSAVEDSNTDLAAVDLMRRFIAKINKQHRKNLPTKHFTARTISGKTQLVCSRGVFCVW